MDRCAMNVEAFQSKGNAGLVKGRPPFLCGRLVPQNNEGFTHLSMKPSLCLLSRSRKLLAAVFDMLFVSGVELINASCRVNQLLLTCVERV